MNEQALLHLEYPSFLWLLLLIPLCLLLKRVIATHYRHTSGGWLSCIDRHLLPFLLASPTDGANKKRHPVMAAIIRYIPLFIVGCMVVALAGPRYDFTDIKRPSVRPLLAVILDISYSMNAEDIPPSRIVRARQEIEDIIRRMDGIDIALIAFAADAQIIIPPTSDIDTIITILPDLGTDIPAVQGSSFASAIKALLHIKQTATHLDTMHAVMLTDGGFSDTSDVSRLSDTLQDQHITLHIMGIGEDPNAAFLDTQRRQRIPAAFSEETLRTLAEKNNGTYIPTDYSDRDTRALADIVSTQFTNNHTGRDTARVWEEYFYVALIPGVILIYILFYQTSLLLVPAALCALFCFSSAEAASIKDIFLNDAQRGAALLKHKAYDEAEQTFNSPYRKGIAAYRAGKFHEAETYFSTSEPSSDHYIDATYNLGNALARQGKLNEAVSAYERVLKKQPDHKHAEHNANIVRYMLKQQEEEQQQQQQPSEDNQQQESSEDASSDNSSPSQEPSEASESSRSDTQPSQDQADNASSDASNSQQEPNDNISQKEDLSALPDEATQQNSSTNDNADQQDIQAPPSQPKAERSERDIRADLWLNRIQHDNRAFLRNRFYIESLENNTQQGSQPW